MSIDPLYPDRPGLLFHPPSLRPKDQAGVCLYWPPPKVSLILRHVCCNRGTTPSLFTKGKTEAREKDHA